MQRPCRAYAAVSTDVLPKATRRQEPLSDVEFYMYVREWCVTEPIQRVAETLRKKTSKAPTLEEVYEEFSDSGTILTTENGLKHVIETGALGIKPDAEIGGLRKKYDRGRDFVTGKK